MKLLRYFLCITTLGLSTVTLLAPPKKEPVKRQREGNCEQKLLALLDRWEVLSGDVVDNDVKKTLGAILEFVKKDENRSEKLKIKFALNNWSKVEEGLTGAKRYFAAMATALKDLVMSKKVEASKTVASFVEYDIHGLGGDLGNVTITIDIKGLVTKFFEQSMTGVIVNLEKALGITYDQATRRVIHIEPMTLEKAKKIHKALKLANESDYSRKAAEYKLDLLMGFTNVNITSGLDHPEMKFNIENLFRVAKKFKATKMDTPAKRKQMWDLFAAMRGALEEDFGDDVTEYE